MGSDNYFFRCAVLSVPKHDYLPRGVASHPRFQLVVVADDDDQPDWVHERNELFARQFQIPYVRDVNRGLREFGAKVAVISSQAERHCDLTVRAASAGLHIVQDKPMSTRLSECDRAVQAVETNRVRFLMWNRNGLPAIQQAREAITNGAVGRPQAIHVDFYFSKDAGPPKGSLSDPPIDWLTFQIAAHVDGSDGALGTEPIGELRNEGVYPLAYIHYLTGATFRRVFARTAAHFHQVNVDNSVEDLASVTLEMELPDHQRLTGSIAIGRIGAASHPDLGEIKLHIIGTEGALVISEPRPEVSVYYRGQPEKEFRHRRVAADNDWVLMEDFAGAIDMGTPTMLDVRASRHLIATIEAALESARTGRAVDVV